jgi:hypothetical protein
MTEGRVKWSRAKSCRRFLRQDAYSVDAAGLATEVTCLEVDLKRASEYGSLEGIHGVF